VVVLVLVDIVLELVDEVDFVVVDVELDVA
jgi:hypothetical protein